MIKIKIKIERGDGYDSKYITGESNNKKWKDSMKMKMKCRRLIVIVYNRISTLDRKQGNNIKELKIAKKKVQPFSQREG